MVDAGEERLVFTSLISLDVFFIATILYLVSYVPNGAAIAKAWVFATVIVVTLAVLLRIAAIFVARRFFRGLSYLALVISLGSQLYAISLLLSL